MPESHEPDEGAGQRFSSLRREAARGVGWMGLSALAANALQFTQRVLLARFLVPEDFGLASITFLVIGLADLCADLGLSNAIIQRKVVSRNELSSLYWFKVCAGAGVAGAIVAGAPVIAGYFGQPRLEQVIRWAALNFLIVPFGQQFQVLLQKEMLFARLARLEAVAQFVGTAATLSFAFAGQGVFALVWGLLITTGVRTVLLVMDGRSRWAPTRHFAWRDVRGYARFGAYQSAGFGASYLASNVDYIVIGRYLGAEALGIYALAYQLVTWPLTKINPIVGRVVFSVLSRVQDDDSALRRAYLETTRLLATALFPLLAVLAASAPWLVPLLFGSQWRASAPLVQILIAVGAVKTVAAPSSNVLLAKGRPELSFLFALAIGVTNALAFWLVVARGSVFVALANSIVSLIFLPLGWGLMYYGARVKPAESMKALRLPSALSLLLGVTLHAGYVGIGWSTARDMAALMGLTLAGLGLYAALAWRLGRESGDRPSGSPPWWLLRGGTRAPDAGLGP